MSIFPLCVTRPHLMAPLCRRWPFDGLRWSFLVRPRTPLLLHGKGLMPLMPWFNPSWTLMLSDNRFCRVREFMGISWKEGLPWPSFRYPNSSSLVNVLGITPRANSSWERQRRTTFKISKRKYSTVSKPRHWVQNVNSKSQIKCITKVHSSTRSLTVRYENEVHNGKTLGKIRSWF